MVSCVSSLCPLSMTQPVILQRLLPFQTLSTCILSSSALHSVLGLSRKLNIYQFCYMYTRTIGEPVTVFTVLILSDEGSVYRIIDSYTEREDRNLCNSTSNTCCKTVTRAVSLTIKSDLAIGFVTADSFGNALYQSNTAFSPGFVVSGSIVPSTDINRAINSTDFSGVRPRISNRRFSVNFTIDSSITATTNAISSMDTRTSMVSDISRFNVHIVNLNSVPVHVTLIIIRLSE